MLQCATPLFCPSWEVNFHLCTPQVGRMKRWPPPIFTPQIGCSQLPSWGRQGRMPNSAISVGTGFATFETPSRGFFLVPPHRVRRCQGVYFRERFLIVLSQVLAPITARSAHVPKPSVPRLPPRRKPTTNPLYLRLLQQCRGQASISIPFILPNKGNHFLCRETVKAFPPTTSQIGKRHFPHNSQISSVFLTQPNHGVFLTTRDWMCVWPGPRHPDPHGAAAPPGCPGRLRRRGRHLRVLLQWRRPPGPAAARGGELGPTVWWVWIPRDLSHFALSIRSLVLLCRPIFGERVKGYLKVA